MYMELQYLREQAFYNRVADRLKKGDANPNRVSKSLEEVMGAEAYKEFREIDPDAIPDEDLFE